MAQRHIIETYGPQPNNRNIWPYNSRATVFCHAWPILLSVFQVSFNSLLTLVNPYFLYSNIVWASTYYTCTKCLILLQKRAIRIIARDKYYDHTSKRFQELAIMKFDCINRYLTGNFLFKYFNNLLPPVFTNFFTITIDVHEHYTRAVSGLSVQYARTNYRRFSLYSKGPIIWNEIPANIRAVKSFPQFKSLWKAYIKSGDDQIG